MIVAATLILLCFFAPASVLANRNCTDAEKRDADKWLFLNARDKKLATDKHLPWGTPVPANLSGAERVLIHFDYIIGYHDELRVPAWTAYRLEARGLNRVAGRVECFRPDVRIPANAQSTPADYDEPLFDQGHVAPSEDMSHNTRRNVNSFIMSNMAPQHGAFNRVIWRRLEGQGQKWAQMFKVVHVISGSIFDADNDGKSDDAASANRMKSNNGKRRVAVPTHFFKIIARGCDDGRLETVAFVLPHENKSRTGAAAVKFLAGHVVSIAEVESLIGHTLFTHLSSELRLERTSPWPLAAPKSKGALACGQL